jgi:steroid 5-alpha reductase family enzyme
MTMLAMWTLAACGLAGVAVLMFVLWLVHLPLRNAAIVDFGWAVGLGALGVWYAAYGVAPRPRALLLAAMAGIWGLRLGLHLLIDRVIGQPEEGRYQELRRSWGGNMEAKFLAFFEFQALTCVILSAPFLLTAANTSEEVHGLEWAAAALWLIAMLGEALADAQLKAFKANPAHRGQVCQQGLWHYSRHPNYFFEWLIWVAFALLGTTAPYGWAGWFSPAMILYFLLRVTGIPATEEQSVRSRGEAYRRYQRTTSAFVPWFPKHEAGA